MAARFDVKRDSLQARNLAARRRAEPVPSIRTKVGWPVTLFLLALLVPWVINVGTLRMSLYRIVLIVMLFPCLRMWLAGKAGGIKAADIVLLLYSLWFTLSLVVNHGVGESLQPAGITFVETLGPYLLARCYIRDANDFENLFRLLFKIALLVLPFATWEFIVGKDIWRDLFAAVWPVQVYENMPPRGDLYRVQMGFDHPILFGVYVGSLVAPVYLVLGHQKSFLGRAGRTGVVAALSFMSLSAGPLIGVVVQGALLLWNELLKTVQNRWRILIILSAALALLVELVANRSLLNILVTLFVFDDGSFWFRLFIWEYGSASVANHPLFGIGLNDWERPAWMFGSSIDDFWLFLAVRYGLLAPVLLLLTLATISLGLAFKKNLDERTAAYRTAYLISIVAFFLVAWSVHYWDAGYVFFLFFVGSGVWMLEVASKNLSEPRAKGRGLSEARTNSR